MSTHINVKAKVNFYDYIENLSAILLPPLTVYTPLEGSASTIAVLLPSYFYCEQKDTANNQILPYTCNLLDYSHS